jgi:hypothetical protein
MLSTAGGRRRARPPRPLILVALVALALSAAGAQGPERVLEAEAAQPQPLVKAEELARLLGVEIQTAGETLVLRGGGVVLTAFAGGAEVVVGGPGAGEASLSAPVERREDGWWLPLDAGDPFGLARTGPATLAGPDGQVWSLRVRPPPETSSRSAVRARVLRPAAGAVAVELRSAPAQGGAERRAWLTDLALVPLIAPEVREAVDDALAEAGAARALLLVVTARSDGARAEGVAIEADGRELLAPGERHATLAGDAEAIGPEAPWLALVWLPPGTRLDRPLTVRWQGAEVEVTFRR